MAWAALYFQLWPKLPQGPINTGLSLSGQGLLLYFLYSFANYWWHRYKHKNPYLWRIAHKVHHFPSKMETILAFFRHPIEIILNTLILGFIAWCLSLSIAAIAIALTIECLFEIYHHSNIKTPKWLRPISHVIQTTEMHLIHHEKGHHRNNYGTISLWDTIFKTKKIPTNWKGEQGLELPKGILGVFMCQK